MLGRFFTRTASARYAVFFFVIALLLIYGFKQLYEKYQKETRFQYYKNYVEEIKVYANKIESSDNKSFHYMQQINKLLKMSLLRVEAESEKS